MINFFKKLFGNKKEIPNNEHIRTTEYIPRKNSVQEKIINLAEKYNWRLTLHQEEQLKLRFTKNKNDIIDVWYSKMTVGTTINHPKGRKTLFRKRVNLDLLEKIFNNPRQHTGAGYFKK